MAHTQNKKVFLNTTHISRSARYIPAAVFTTHCNMRYLETGLVSLFRDCLVVLRNTFLVLSFVFLGEGGGGRGGRGRGGSRGAAARAAA